VTDTDPTVAPTNETPADVTAPKDLDRIDDVLAQRIHRLTAVDRLVFDRRLL
jgi:hypothetical protein